MMTQRRARGLHDSMTIRRRFRRYLAAGMLAVAAVVAASCEPHHVEAWLAATAPPAPTTHQQWAALRHCESGAHGLYRAVSRTGKYRGAYQMDRSFWLAHGGDPAYASPPRWEQAPTWMQDRVAYAGYRARGRQPWTSGGSCGYRLSPRPGRRS